MGYRLRLGNFPKKVWEEKYKEKTEEELIQRLGDKDSYFSFAYPPEHTQLYELGKYVDFQNEEFTPFYSFELEENDFWIVSKKGLLSIIEKYHKVIHEYYQDLKKSFEDKTEEGNQKIRSHLVQKNNEWHNGFGLKLYYLDQDKTDGFITGSWNIEYAIFNLVYIYRTFDFENDLLIYSGW